MEVWISKAMTAVFLLGLTLAFGLLPVWLVHSLLSSRSGSRAAFVLSALNCVAGGVFLGTTFLHLLPDVQQSMDAVLQVKGIDSQRFHVAECVICGGFFIIMLIEHLVMSIQHHHSDVSMESIDSGSETDDHHHAGLEDAEGDEQIAVLGKAVMTSDDTDHRPGHNRWTNYGSISHEHESGEHDLCKNSVFAVHDKLVVSEQRHLSHSGGDRRLSPGGTGTPVDSKPHRSHTLQSVVEEGGGSVHIIHPNHHQRHHVDGKQLQGIRSFVLLIALSLHTVFEGLALGLQASSKEVWTLFTALAIHKSIIAFTLGLQFAENVSRTSRVLLFVIFFSLMSPLGVVLGTVVSETSAGYSTDVANAVLQGLATGTFIHVTFFEVLQREVGQDHSVLKVLAVVVGFLIIALVNIVV